MLLAHLQAEVGKAEVNFIEQSGPYRLFNKSKSRHGLDQANGLCPVPNHPRKALDLVEGLEIGEHEDGCTGIEYRRDLIRRTGIDGVNARKAGIPPNRREDLTGVGDGVFGDSGAETLLALQLANLFEIDADPIDAGDISSGS